MTRPTDSHKIITLAPVVFNGVGSSWYAPTSVPINVKIEQQPNNIEKYIWRASHLLDLRGSSGSCARMVVSKLMVTKIRTHTLVNHDRQLCTILNSSSVINLYIIPQKLRPAKMAHGAHRKRQQKAVKKCARKRGRTWMCSGKVGRPPRARRAQMYSRTSPQTKIWSRSMSQLSSASPFQYTRGRPAMVVKEKKTGFDEHETSWSWWAVRCKLKTCGDQSDQSIESGATLLVFSYYKNTESVFS